jgi:peptide/nickel transport system substrate-binding protein
VWPDEIELFAITDPISRVNALLSGDIHVAADIDAKAVKQVEAQDHVEMWPQPAVTWPAVCCLLDRYRGNNEDFVCAMKYLSNRKRIVRSILKGYGTIGNDHPIGSAYGANHCEALPQRDIDLDKAAFHLKKSGITEAEIEAAPVSSGIMDACLMQQANAAKRGLVSKVKRVPTDGYWSTGWQQKPLNVTGWNMRPTAKVMFSISMKGDAPWNDTHWKNDRFDQLLVEARGVKDMGVREEMYGEMEQLAADGTGVFIPYFSN